eukprot:TRINITY_DN23820_c0_g1_i1.p1 TRINITY_DN23820_c0_g1~~TRINITY_DN23820_c0_g1_i1.p1  ORF type:complete len:208 (-),score=11.78 TRINITY_DN23820_c0_g1_i1:52-675(-)
METNVSQVKVRVLILLAHGSRDPDCPLTHLPIEIVKMILSHLPPLLQWAPHLAPRPDTWKVIGNEIHRIGETYDNTVPLYPPFCESLTSSLYATYTIKLAKTSFPSYSWIGISTKPFPPYGSWVGNDKNSYALYLKNGIFRTKCVEKPYYSQPIIEGSLVKLIIRNAKLEFEINNVSAGIACELPLGQGPLYGVVNIRTQHEYFVLI